MADSVLLGSIQSSLDALDLKEMREQAKAATEVEQEKQKARFDAKRSKPPQYAVGDIVVVATNPVATGQSNKLVAKSKGPFKVTAVLPNDRYEVQDLRELQKSRRQKTVVAVDRMKRWISFNALE
ncbi:uncharacterized protein LOC123269316 [Cotesia glomerata]|uniref:uncharacterized protein LOC123269316 n=1 Tax=Cotesia glomerata TaxID=32391 RepID=UPI001D02E9EF|nr:uncharacterized protein LOC123269316 [Cotesia glomerata]